MGMLAAVTFVSTAAVAQQRANTRDPGNAMTTAQNDAHGKIQKQTNPKKNGTSQSESTSGQNKNGQPQK